jgi:glycosyltransferase involved in cell wall biosynthesis
MRVLYTGRCKKGTPVPDIIKMVHYNHPEVEFIPYSPDEEGDVILSINRTSAEDRRGIRKVIYIGSIPSLLKTKYCYNISSSDHVVFISDYCGKLFSKGWKIKNKSSVLTVGSLPVDSSMEFLDKPRKIDGPIQFIAIAKWYKRPYKRLRQIEKLFNKYIKVEYPDSILNVVGYKKEKKEGSIHYYKKSFHNGRVIDIFKNSHIHLVPTSFDTGPKTIGESLHYRVPFVCSNNCAGSEYIKKLGKCGIVVQTDQHIDLMKKYHKWRPLSPSSDFNRKQIPYERYLKAIKKIVNNYEEYTSWQWNEKLNYKLQSDTLYSILRGK